MPACETGEPPARTLDLLGEKFMSSGGVLDPRNSPGWTPNTLSARPMTSSVARVRFVHAVRKRSGRRGCCSPVVNAGSIQTGVESRTHSGRAAILCYRHPECQVSAHRGSIASRVRPQLDVVRETDLHPDGENRCRKQWDSFAGCSEHQCRST